jgi:hypothetical protein
MVSGLIAMIVYTSLDSKDPASQPPTGATPPQGEPMKSAG